VGTRPEDPAAAGRGRLRAGHADREYVIDTLKDAFVHGRLTKDEFDARAGQALIARTRADLAALTADIPGPPAMAGSARPAVAEPARPPAPARRRPLARAAARSGMCLIITGAAIWIAVLADANDPGPDPYGAWAAPLLYLAVNAFLAALCFLGYGVATALGQRRSRGQLPPGARVLEGERRGVGRDHRPPGVGSGHARADLRVHGPRRHRKGLGLACPD